MVDYIMNEAYGGGPFTRSMAQNRKCKPGTVKGKMNMIYRIYGIDGDKYVSYIRLIYLRSKELGML